MIALCATLWLLGADAPIAKPATDTTSVIGVVRLTKAVGAPQVSLKPQVGAETVLKGDLLPEIRRLQSYTVEALGLVEGGQLLVHAYRIIDVGGGARPLVGLLVETASGLALMDGEGAPLPLNVSAKLKRKLLDQLGAKTWVVGEKLVSGELKVTRFGVLKEPVRAQPPAVPDDAAPDAAKDATVAPQ